MAIEVRTNRRRLILNLRRYRSTSRSCRCMIVSCSWLGGGGMYSPLEHGSTSTGSPSHWSGHDLFHLIILATPLSGCLLVEFPVCEHCTTLTTPCIPGWIPQ